MSPSLALAPTLVLILSTFSSFRALAQIDGTCYFPAGNIADNNVPCDPDAAVSSCCAQESSCLANGLCLVNNDDDTVEFARGACTDPTFQDPACFQHCHGSQPGSPDSNGAAVFECGSVGFVHPANYCCENGIDRKVACCSIASLIFSLSPGTYSGMSATRTPSGPSLGGPGAVSTDVVTVTDVESCTTTLPGGSVSILSMTSASYSFVSGATATPSSGNASGAAVTASSGVTAQPASTNGTASNNTSTGGPTVATASASRKELAWEVSLGAVVVVGLRWLL